MKLIYNDPLANFWHDLPFGAQRLQPDALQPAARVGRSRCTSMIARGHFIYYLIIVDELYIRTTLIIHWIIVCVCLVLWLIANYCVIALVELAHHCCVIVCVRLKETYLEYRQTNYVGYSQLIMKFHKKYVNALKEFIAGS